MLSGRWGRGTRNELRDVGTGDGDPVTGSTPVPVEAQRRCVVLQVPPACLHCSPDEQLHRLARMLASALGKHRTHVHCCGSAFQHPVGEGHQPVTDAQRQVLHGELAAGDGAERQVGFQWHVRNGPSRRRNGSGWPAFTIRAAPAAARDLARRAQVPELSETTLTDGPDNAAPCGVPFRGTRAAASRDLPLTERSE
jgi:hypothetical protein